MTTQARTDGIAHGRLESAADGEVVLAPPHSEYRIHLACDRDLGARVGHRVRGRIEANALRMHAAAGGGRFIEPMWGAPRIVAGVVVRRDEATGRVLVDLSVPVWIAPPEGQDESILEPGTLVNCYVESGATFVPEPDDGP